MVPEEGSLAWTGRPHDQHIDIIFFGHLYIDTGGVIVIVSHIDFPDIFADYYILALEEFLYLFSVLHCGVGGGLYYFYNYSITD